MLLGAILPIIFGAITSKVVDMEASAGRFQIILSAQNQEVRLMVENL